MNFIDSVAAPVCAKSRSKVGNMDSERVLLRVEKAKGRKDRHAMRRLP